MLSAFMERELKRSQYPATGPFREPGESNQQPQIFIILNFNIILSENM
jgi:hypothetical protein